MATVVEDTESPTDDDFKANLDYCDGCSVFVLPLPVAVLDRTARVAIENHVMAKAHAKTGALDFSATCTPTRLVVVVPDDQDKGHERMISLLATGRGEDSLLSWVNEAIEDSRDNEIGRG